MPLFILTVKNSKGDTLKSTALRFDSLETVFECYDKVSKSAYKESQEKRDYLLAKMIDKKIQAETGEDILKWFYFSSRIKGKMLGRIHEHAKETKLVKNLSFKELSDLVYEMNVELGVK